MAIHSDGLATQDNSQMPSALTQRLLHDIAEIRKEPYPNIRLHIDESDFRNACLILTPEGVDPLHLAIQFPDDYPIRAPIVTIQSYVNHPNIFGNYICATMLNTDEGWTPAYTVKGVVIQLLSFFASDSLEQDHGEGAIDLNRYRNSEARGGNRYSNVYTQHGHICNTCGFGTVPRRAVHSTPSRQGSIIPQAAPHAGCAGTHHAQHQAVSTDPSKTLELPDELWLMVFENLDTADILTFSDAVPSVKAMVNSYDFIRTRELQCFCLKKNFLDAKLGIGVSIAGGKRSTFRSEFDLISHEAFANHGVRKSIQGVPFGYWLPLPLSRRHWNLVRLDTYSGLRSLHHMARLERSNEVEVLYSFMNSIVIQFSADSERLYNGLDERSTLSHASEKAVESYFALFHLLLCIATEKPHFIAAANQMVSGFLAGPRTKVQFPDLGILLVATLISDAGLTENFTYELIKEAIVRNVVWMLESAPKGRGMPELTYLEPSAFSDYRLKNTFQASLTSYRLLMFGKLFSSSSRKSGMTLVQLRDQLFDTHGAPPSGTSTWMAQQIKHIHNIPNFPSFLQFMGIQHMPTKENFCAFLKRTIKESETIGYSALRLTQTQAFVLRRKKEPNVPASDDVDLNQNVQLWIDRGCKVPSFFPSGDGYGSRGDWSGRRGRSGRRR
jgi:ubiquitin-protein ligase